MPDPSLRIPRYERVALVLTSGESDVNDTTERAGSSRKDDLGIAREDRQVAAEITLVGALSLPALSTATMAKYQVLEGRFWKE